FVLAGQGETGGDGLEGQFLGNRGAEGPAVVGGDGGPQGDMPLPFSREIAEQVEFVAADFHAEILRARLDRHDRGGQVGGQAQVEVGDDAARFVRGTAGAEFLDLQRLDVADVAG